jgi:sugar phosphate isomerase/epimerase
VSIPVALQLWTVRQEMAKDLAAAFAAIGNMGYAGVELWFAQYPETAEILRIADRSGLRVASAHVPFLDLRDHFDGVASYHSRIGNRNLVIPFLPVELRDSEEAWKARIDEIAQIAERCWREGFVLSYHNHDFEFQASVDGRAAHDVLFETVPAAHLKVELDVSFLHLEGRDPAVMIRRYKDRGPLLHLKEVHKDHNRYQNAEVGHGVLDWDSIFAAASEAGVEWYIVEQNCQERPALESVRMSIEYLRKKGVVT